MNTPLKRVQLNHEDQTGLYLAGVVGWTVGVGVEVALGFGVGVIVGFAVGIGVAVGLVVGEGVAAG